METAGVRGGAWSANGFNSVIDQVVNDCLQPT